MEALDSPRSSWLFCSRTNTNQGSCLCSQFYHKFYRRISSRSPSNSPVLKKLSEELALSWKSTAVARCKALCKFCRSRSSTTKLPSPLTISAGRTSTSLSADRHYRMFWTQVTVDFFIFMSFAPSVSTIEAVLQKLGHW